MKKILIALVVLAILISIGAYAYTASQKARVARIQSFDECKAAGYPIMESYPERCATPDGRSFTAATAEVIPSPVTSGEGSNPPGSIHNLPVPEAVAKTRSALSTKLGLDEQKITVLEAIERDWPDACLGVSDPGTMCAQVITPGYAITLFASGLEYYYRTNASGSVIVQTDKPFMANPQ